ncbi:MAG: 16S rRNA (guanine(966)-N(2))-methyltransferase RsmD [Lachnospiraceae bacterium]
MRVIAGSARSLQLITPGGLDTRPTTDRIKETLFNILQTDIPGCVFVDLFSGSGGIGIEAISRGAKKSYFAENGKEAIRCIEHNIKHTHFEEKATLLRQDAISALAYSITEPADIVFADPPYGKGFDHMLLECARHAGCVTKDTILIIEEEKQADFSYAESLGFAILKEKVYKNNKHVFLRKIGEGEI